MRGGGTACAGASSGVGDNVVEGQASSKGVGWGRDFEVCTRAERARRLAQRKNPVK